MVYQHCEFHDPLGKGTSARMLSYILKIHDFSKNILHSWACIRQPKSIVMTTNKTFTKFVNFMTPVTGVLVLRHSHIIHIVKILNLC